MKKNNTYEEVSELIRNSNDIVVAGHISPDGDAVASSLALAVSINKLGIKCRVLIDDYQSRYSFIKGTEYIYRDSYSDLNPDLFIAVDCGDIGRVGKALEVFERAEKKLVIDHHASNNYFGQYNIIEPEASSTSEMIYKLVRIFDNIDIDIASALYAGIVFDTGGLRFQSTSPETLKTIISLYEYGIPFTDIYTEIMSRHSFNEAKIFSRAISKMNMENGIVSSYVTQAELQEFSVKSGALEGIAEYMINTRGAAVSVFAYEKAERDIKISFRSTGIDVSKIAVEFGGGGHIYAAGCSMEEDVLTALSKAVSRVERELKNDE
ncbi:DHH family phosphoesterase [Anaeropeptidivorans aminofermentans]|jgi:phosphoesterase RecJ-like protein|uniref:DHH family phosphoesterase n=1 Tax=Anaeropeptidivorans aminofermentans TaxID=2934315 RepID=UPI00202561D5|nr:bifunctional oligoribonuclease/PAP phosphatase NrnA [Anaeropeptidivorans aminofermentans]